MGQDLAPTTLTKYLHIDKQAGNLQARETVIFLLSVNDQSNLYCSMQVACLRLCTN